MRDAFQTVYLYLILCLFIFPCDAHGIFLKQHDKKHLQTKESADALAPEKSLVYPDSLAQADWSGEFSSRHRSNLPSFANVDENDKTSLESATLEKSSSTSSLDVKEAEDEESTASSAVEEKEAQEEQPDTSKKCIRKHTTEVSSATLIPELVAARGEETKHEKESEKTPVDDKSAEEAKENPTPHDPEPTWNDVFTDIKDKAMAAREHIMSTQTTTQQPSPSTKEVKDLNRQNGASRSTVTNSTKKSGLPTWVWSILAVLVLGIIGGVLYFVFNRSSEVASPI